jgi:hypothetical protein
VYNICVGCARDAAPAACDRHTGGMRTSDALCARDAAPAACDRHTGGMRTSDAFVARVSSIHVDVAHF